VVHEGMRRNQEATTVRAVNFRASPVAAKARVGEAKEAAVFKDGAVTAAVVAGRPADGAALAPRNVRAKMIRLTIRAARRSSR
jgi:hypothetical protein